MSNLKRAFGFQEVDEDDIDELLAREQPPHVPNPFGAPHAEPPARSAATPSAPAAPAPAEPATPAVTPPDRRLLDETDRLQTALKKARQERDACQQAQLSAERRNRALLDRLDDLERRLKAAESASALRPRPASAPAPQPADTPASDIAELEQEAESLRRELHRRDVAIADLNTALADEKRLNSIYKRDLDTLQVKTKMADAMVADLTAKAAKATRQLRDANEELDAAAEAMKHLDRIEEYKKRTDTRIAELQRTVALRDKEIRSLNTTLEHHMRRQADNEALLRREIETLRDNPSAQSRQPLRDTAGADPEGQPSTQRRRRKGPVDDQQPTLF